jgi:hypothetical protein
VSPLLLIAAREGHAVLHMQDLVNARPQQSERLCFVSGSPQGARSPAGFAGRPTGVLQFSHNLWQRMCT